MIRNVYVILAGLIAVAVICTAGVILHSIGGYHIELTPIIATVGAAGGIALICHEFGYSAGRNKALNDRRRYSAPAFWEVLLIPMLCLPAPEGFFQPVHARPPSPFRVEAKR
ncbi:hypothetical protein [Pseudomonas aeruginosa]|uniref:hypothetical protein n=1 Tax=Pseudomonas aeruginosa TaxID=287 RepID=UPI000AD6F416|nr:hypothetical protein [Pseudomonas aeruginosa]